MTHTRVLDEKGQEWIVKGKDPAMPLVRKLTRYGLRDVVLLRRTVTTGEMVASSVRGQGGGQSVRMADCLTVLQTDDIGSLLFPRDEQ